MSMKYDAVTFDTQVVIRNGFNFNGGLLAQLSQFKNGPTRVVVSQMTVLEVLKHLVENTGLFSSLFFEGGFGIPAAVNV
jgi:hypothetical protein